MNSKSVYISFSHKDRGIADPILSELGKLNINYWFDEHIQSGELWVDTIEDALDEASVYVLLMSPDFISSEWSMYELGHAITAFRKTRALLIPVVIGEVAIPTFLKNIQYIDATSMPPKEIARRIGNIIEHNEKYA